MALLMYLNKERFRPENPIVIDAHLNDDVMLSFVDLIPSVIKRSTSAAMTAVEVEYHSFREIMDLANSWLERNPNWQVFNCETVMLYYKFNDKMSYYELRPNDSYFYIYGSEKNNVLKALRIWVKRKRVKDRQYIDVQNLNYYDLIPEQLNEFGKYENLDHMLKRANNLMKTGEITGQLITVESLICESSGLSWRVEPDVTLSAVSTKKMIVLRIFYQENAMIVDSEFGILDFVPRHLSGGGLFKRPKYEPFDELLTRVYIWLSEQPDVRLINLKTLDVKLKSSGTDIDTKMMHYHEHGCYIRILRLSFAIEKKPTSNISTTSEQEPSTSAGPESTMKEASKAPEALETTTVASPKQKCWLHQSNGSTGDEEEEELDGEKKSEPEVPRHPDEEEIAASEEQAQEEAKRQRRLRSRCTCKSETGNTLLTRKSDQPLLLSSKYFSSLRRNETIQQMQQRIHEYVANPVNARVSNQRRAALLLIPTENDARRASTSVPTNRKNSVLLPTTTETSAKENEEARVSQAELDSVAQNVICAETINIFGKSIEVDLNAELNETFQYNRFGTRNGYIFVSFRLYFDCKSNEQIEDYKTKERAAAVLENAETPTALTPTGTSGPAAAAARRFRKALKGLNARLRPGSAATPLTSE